MIRSLLLLCCFAVVFSQKIYTREFQLNLDLDYFEDNREDGIEHYVQMWGEGASHNPNTFTKSNSVRRETTVRDISPCGGDGYVRQREYVSGDLEGLVTIDMKSNGALSLAEAESEPYQPSEVFQNVAEQQIEYDVHTCEADYAANTRLFLDETKLFDTCDGVNELFPDAVSGSSQQLSVSESDSATFSSYWEGEYLGGKITLDVTIQYGSVNDAVEDNNPSSGEFSFTMYSADAGNSFSQQQTEMGIHIYDYMLERVGSTGEEYPCGDGTTVSDFFEVDQISDSQISSVQVSSVITSNFSPSSEENSASGISITITCLIVSLLLSL